MTRDTLIEEPFRIFFPAGILVGVYGIALWPLSLWGGAEAYPGMVHSRLMVMGMFGAFVIGFLGTSMPRMFGVGPLGGGFVLTIGLGWTASVVAHSQSVHRVGDLLFGVTLTMLAVAILKPFPRRTDLPPPALILTGFGLSFGVVGSVLLAWADGGGGTFAARFGRVAVNEGFLLGVIGGVGAFFFPRLWGSASKQSFPEMLYPNRAWARRGRIALWAGLGLVAGCICEALGWVRIGSIMRLGVFALFVASEISASVSLRSETTLGALVRLGLLTIPLGLVLETVAAPGQLVGVRHIVMVGGFNLIFFAVATRVVFGHSGARKKTLGRMVLMRWLGALLLIVVATRVSADFFPAVYSTHLGYASLLWLIGTFLWSGFVLWRVLIPDEA